LPKSLPSIQTLFSSDVPEINPDWLVIYTRARAEKALARVFADVI
jgi:hypothetical protein